MEPTLTAVTPIYSEEKNIPDFIPDVIWERADRKWNLIIIDDGSKDCSYQHLKEFNKNTFMTIVHHKLNRGYGGSLKSGTSRVTTSRLVTIDGDGQHWASDIALLVEFAITNGADLVKRNRGRLFQGDIFRSPGKWVIWNSARILLALPVKDLNSGFKLYRTDLAKRYTPLCPDLMAFSDAMILADINQRDLVLECPMHFIKRAFGRSTINIRTAFETIIEILNIAILVNPLRVFFPAASLCI